jgi:DNA-binding GntR family transcriptional regulator
MKRSGIIREIEHLSLHEKVYAEIRRSLMAGQFEPGQKIVSRKLAVSLGTSDMPVRTALARLIAEGGLVQLGNGLTSVPSCSRRDFKQVMDLRVMLEARATHLACGNLTKSDFKALDGLAVSLDQASQAKDVSRYLDVNQSLKFCIYNRCGSEILLSMLRMLWLRIGPALRRLSESLDSIALSNFHAEAIAALKQLDAPAAGDAIARDIAAGRDLLLETAQFDHEEQPAVRASRGRSGARE